MDENSKKADIKILDNVRKALIKNHFDCEVFLTLDEAKKFIVNKIGRNKKIGMGGSVTASDMSIADILTRNSNKIYSHNQKMSLEERRKLWLKAIDSDFYIASPQAVTRDGKLVFIDGNGNRCAAITWGPKELILIAGKNKITRDQDDGLWRARNIAAIKNNIRLDKKNPCVVSGKCEDCFSPERICNIVTILWKKPNLTKVTVVLINEELGY
ncbi:MAG: lactate utilization protein [Elusimicrobiales bacterium]|jgi:hypothetical protein|nr:lactate utilization protein [Elusimicrobiales bacterium]